MVTQKCFQDFWEVNYGDMPPLTHISREKLFSDSKSNHGFSFSLTRVDDFDGYNDPRKNDIYSFNIAEA